MDSTINTSESLDDLAVLAGLGDAVTPPSPNAQWLVKLFLKARYMNVLACLLANPVAHLIN